MPYVRPDKFFLKTVNKAEDCRVALTENGKLCGALTRVSRTVPKGGGTICYTAALTSEELEEAVRRKKTNFSEINNFYCRLTGGARLIAAGRSGMPDWTRAADYSGGIIPSCDMALLSYGLPVFCVANAVLPGLVKAEVSYDERPYNESGCVMLRGALVFKESLADKAEAVKKSFGDAGNLIYYDIDPFRLVPPYAYNSMDLIAHDDIMLNFSEMRFRKGSGVIQDNPFLISADWDRVFCLELLNSELQRGYANRSKNPLKRSKKSFDEVWDELKDSSFFTRDRLEQIKQQVDDWNREIISGHNFGSDDSPLQQ